MINNNLYIIRNAIDMDLALAAGEMVSHMNVESNIHKDAVCGSREATRPREIVRATEQFMTDAINIACIKKFGTWRNTRVLEGLAAYLALNPVLLRYPGCRPIAIDQRDVVHVALALGPLSSRGCFTFNEMPSVHRSGPYAQEHFELGPGDAILWLGGVAREMSSAPEGRYMVMAFK
ncbi:MAG: hypothetical protein M1829_005807 [Trizodia sp. TS-e1964]|nr:MAG: hypothetical protein M1829_005807 [Trizodia sp. TS-e1964]